MPFTLDESTISEFITAFGDGVRGEKDRYVDTRTGSAFDNIAGPAAILWNRETVRDTDLFRNIYFASAEDDQLTEIGSTRYNIPRILDSQGTGFCIVSRPTSGGGSGTFPVGTRLSIVDVNGALLSRTYEIAANTTISATAKNAQLPIKAVEFGSQTSIDTLGTSLYIRWEDPLWDNTWAINQVRCDGGTDYESAQQYRARIKTTEAAARKGYIPLIVQTCLNAGAVNVVTFASNYAGNINDFGINAIYVGDNGFNGTIDLCNACTVALETARVFGADLTVRSLTSTVLNVNANVYLFDDPSEFDLGLLSNILINTLANEFSGSNGFSYTLDQLSGALMEAANAVQYATFNTPSVDAPVMQTINGLLNFPATLPKYVLGSVVLNYKDPI